MVVAVGIFTALLGLREGVRAAPLKSKVLSPCHLFVGGFMEHSNIGKRICLIFMALSLSLACSLISPESKAADNDPTPTPGTEGAPCTFTSNCRGVLKCCGPYGSKVCTAMCKSPKKAGMAGTTTSPTGTLGGVIQRGVEGQSTELEKKSPAPTGQGKEAPAPK